MTLSQFNHSGTRLATLGPDGLLSVWSHSSASEQATLLQKFSTSSHLSAAPSCLSWCPGQVTQADTDLIALGTDAGNVYVYSTALARLVDDRKVAGKVMSVCWGDGNMLYVGSDNGSVHVLSLQTVPGPKPGVTTISHPSLHSPVHSIAVHGQTLALASRNIILWDMGSKSVIKTLTGHANPVTSVHYDPSGQWLVSSAAHERLVSLWNVTKVKKTGSSAAMVVNDEISSVNLCDNRVAVVTSRGKLCVFRINYKQLGSNTIQPYIAISIVRDTSEHVPISTAHLVRDSDVISVSYQTVDRLQFPMVEHLTLTELENKSQITRQLDRDKRSSQRNGQQNNVVTPQTDGKVVFLAPGPSLSSVTNKSGRKRGAEKAGDKEKTMPVEDRLSLLSTSTMNTTTSPRTDTLTQLLVQGLHSNDARILDSVLDRADITLIDNTVRRLPAEAVLPLVTVLQKYISGRGVFHASHAKWLKSVLSIHTGFLVSVPDCQDLLAPVYSLLEARTQQYNQVLQLRGKLDMMMKKGDDAQAENNVDADKEALAFFQDTSSDESEDMMSDLMINDERDLEESDEDDDDNEDSEVNDEEMKSESD